MTYDEKVNIVRKNIIKNVQIYKNFLVGRYFLYVFENQYFEIYFGTDNYLHLTGVGTRLSSNQFYQLAKNGKLQRTQLFFNKRFPLSTAIKKTNNMKNIDKFICEGYFVIKDLKTETELYPYAITNIDQSVLIGLKTEEPDKVYIPKSFRVKGNIFDKTTNDNLFEVQYIFSKQDKEAYYDRILYAEDDKINELSDEILSKLSKETSM